MLLVCGTLLIIPAETVLLDFSWMEKVVAKEMGPQTAKSGSSSMESKSATSAKTDLKKSNSKMEQILQSLALD